jgi:hypothetical protein
MSISEWCQRLQDTWVSRAISESTWGYPLVGAFHVLALALVGGALLIPHLRGRAENFRWLRRAGLALVVLTGALLFASGAARYAASASFRIKMILLVLLGLNAIAASRRGITKRHSVIALALWTAVIFAARGIAFF